MKLTKPKQTITKEEVEAQTAGLIATPDTPDVSEQEIKEPVKIEGQITDNTESVPEEADPLTYHVGNSDYSDHKIQPWMIWDEYNLDPWEADVVKRILRKKKAVGKNMKESRIEDLEKIIHVCNFKINKLKNS